MANRAKQSGVCVCVCVLVLLLLPGNSQGRKTVPEGESVVENLAVSVRSCSLRFLWSIRERWAGFSNGAAEAPHRALQPAAGRKAPGPILPLGEFPTLGATGLHSCVIIACLHAYLSPCTAHACTTKAHVPMRLVCLPAVRVRVRMSVLSSRSGSSTLHEPSKVLQYLVT